MSRYRYTDDELIMMMLRYCSNNEEVRNELINDNIEFMKQVNEENDYWYEDDHREYLNELCDDLKGVENINLNFKVSLRWQISFIVNLKN